MRATRRIMCTMIGAVLLAGCGSQSSRPASDTREAQQTTTTAAATPTRTPTPERTPSTETTRDTTSTLAREEVSGEPEGVLRATLRHRDGTTALLEFSEPRLFRFETTDLVLTSDGKMCLAVFPDMRAYAVFDAPSPYTFESFADLSPILEPTFSPHAGLPIPMSFQANPPGWKRSDEPFDRERFSTRPPQFHRDITSQIARPVGEYAALRLEGQTAPYFEVRDLEGRMVTLADFEGKAMLIDFWATWCPPCLESMPKLDALDQRYGTAGLVVLGMNMDEGSSAVRTARQFVSSHGFGFKQAQGGDVAAEFGVEVLPTLFLLDRDHTIQAVYIGMPPDEATLRREVEMALR